MKGKLLLALASLILGLATFSANSAYADMLAPGLTGQSHCENWNYNDPNCQASRSDEGGKAAFGEATDKPMVDDRTMKICDEDWNFNDSRCPGYSTGMEGKPAYGEPGGIRTESTQPLNQFCANEGLNVIETNCPGDVRR